MCTNTTSNGTQVRKKENVMQLNGEVDNAQS